MQNQMITRDKVIELAKKMPIEKLAPWYEYGLFIQAHPLVISTRQIEADNEVLLAQELAEWEAASDEDWQIFEEGMAKAA